MSKKAMSEELCEFLTDMETNLSKENNEAIKRRHITTIIMRITLLIMLILTIADWFFLDMLTVSMVSTLKTVDNISAKFNLISNDMATITATVQKIDNDMIPLTPMTKNMISVHDHMFLISREMHNTTNIVNAIDESVYQIDTSMNYVDYRMFGVSQDMNLIGYDMHKMSKPAGWMNKMMPWQQ